MSNDEQQKTFGKIVGMDAIVPTKLLRDDLIECSDGEFHKQEDCYSDCRDGVHGSEEDAHDANVTIVTEILMKEDEWTIGYTTGREGCDDYATGVAYIVDETSHLWEERIGEWLEGNECGDWTNDADLSKRIIELVCENLDGGSEVEVEYDPSEYSAYSGNGACLYSMEIGEYENQIELSRHDELQALHDEGALDDVLDDVNCDVYIHRSKRREKDGETGYYKDVGRETYNPYGRDNECIDAIHSIAGQWHYIVSNDRMNELVTAAIIELGGTK